MYKIKRRFLIIWKLSHYEAKHFAVCFAVRNQTDLTDTFLHLSRVLVAIVATLVVLGTLIDFATEQPKNLIQHTKQDQKRSIRDGIVVRTFLCFSARANTNLLLEVCNLIFPLSCFPVSRLAI